MRQGTVGRKRARRHRGTRSTSGGRGIFVNTTTRRWERRAIQSPLSADDPERSGDTASGLHSFRGNGMGKRERGERGIWGRKGKKMGEDESRKRFLFAAVEAHCSVGKPRVCGNVVPFSRFF